MAANFFYIRLWIALKIVTRKFVMTGWKNNSCAWWKFKFKLLNNYTGCCNLILFWTKTILCNNINLLKYMYMIISSENYIYIQYLTQELNITIKHNLQKELGNGITTPQYKKCGTFRAFFKTDFDLSSLEVSLAKSMQHNINARTN